MFKNLTEAETSALVEARRSFQEYLGVGRQAWEMAFSICRMKNLALLLITYTDLQLSSIDTYCDLQLNIEN